ncbi:MAG: radical SAM protein [Peptoniphilus lacydonensis]|uniref:radical SAM protein n=2 Tax=Peptoniphilus lacydonensis TaxID=1673725 RepID=UPI00290042A1|nr:radical SAM protein [Peptoniphilus lacydonensis]MDU1955601.1 radical SAM protein [Peptoniphilus lacydonensis]MDU5275553.1 radical SAM protein [Peptoniphilus lacydonensis]
MNYKCLGLLYTRKCTEKCPICCFCCSPKRNEKMDKDDAIKFINAAIDNEIRYIGISGGEPFIYLEEIEEIMNHFREECIFNITTNGFWAINKEKTREILERLAKNSLVALKISIDKYHLENISINNIKNILNESKKIGLKVVVGTTILKNDNIGILLTQLKKELISTGVFIHPCYKVGRASICFNDIDFIYDDEIKIECPEGNIIIIDYNGNIYPCGSIFAMEDSRCAGNFFETKFRDLISNCTRICPNINELNKYYNATRFKNNYIDSCDVCYKYYKN